MFLLVVGELLVVDYVRAILWKLTTNYTEINGAHFLCSVV